MPLLLFPSNAPQLQVLRGRRAQGAAGRQSVVRLAFPALLRHYSRTACWHGALSRDSRATLKNGADVRHSLHRRRSGWIVAPRPGRRLNIIFMAIGGHCLVLLQSKGNVVGDRLSCNRRTVLLPCAGRRGGTSSCPLCSVVLLQTSSHPFTSPHLLQRSRKGHIAKRSVGPHNTLCARFPDASSLSQSRD